MIGAAIPHILRKSRPESSAVRAVPAGGHYLPSGGAID
jgi:hypothetical protein